MGKYNRQAHTHMSIILVLFLLVIQTLVSHQLILRLVGTRGRLSLLFLCYFGKKKKRLKNHIISAILT
ncbi:hypothetical protein BD560DRAFT_388885 [Blakeslea trispora]|nr:hypothetical protein BD560DRAFT_388885 [Blakeslea trispora]